MVTQAHIRTNIGINGNGILGYPLIGRDDLPTVEIGGIVGAVTLISKRGIGINFGREPLGKPGSISAVMYFPSDGYKQPIQGAVKGTREGRVLVTLDDDYQFVDERIEAEKKYIEEMTPRETFILKYSSRRPKLNFHKEYNSALEGIAQELSVLSMKVVVRYSEGDVKLDLWDQISGGIYLIHDTENPYTFKGEVVECKEIFIGEGVTLEQIVVRFSQEFDERLVHQEELSVRRLGRS